jgi:hypothetical protein
VSDRENIDQRLARLSGETNALRPSVGFSVRVLQAIELEAQRAPSFWENAWRSSRRLLPVAALAAVLAVAWAAQVESSVDDALATSYASVGFE